MDGLEKPEKRKLVDELSAAIGTDNRPFLNGLAVEELRYLKARADLQERYATPPRGPALLEWEMSAVGRGEEALGEIDAVAQVKWKGAVALDVGCGDGGFLVAMARRGAKAHGIDDCPGNVEGAALRARCWNLSTTAVLATADALPYPAGRFDLVTCGDVLEHVADPAAALGEIDRVLTAGGYFWLAVPTRYFLPHLWRDPHYGYFGVSAMRKGTAAWYLARIRRALPTADHYEVQRLPTYRAMISSLRDLGFVVLSGEHHRLAALREPTRVRKRWKHRFLQGLLGLGLRAPLGLLLTLEAELRQPIRLVCRKKGN